MGNLRTFFSENDIHAIQNAVAKAELKTSGEIRVRIEAHLKNPKDPMKSIRQAFEDAGMRNTKLHNGVMFLLALEDNTFAILGDDGIDKKVPDGFWDNVRDAIINKFKKRRFADGLVEGILLAGEQLAEYFPRSKDDVNELPDAISFADESEEDGRKHD